MMGDLKGTIATCEQAIARGLDGDYIRKDVFSAAYALHDAALIQKQRDWEAAHPDAIYIRLVEAEIALSEGRFVDGRRLITLVEAIMRHQGLGPSADEIVRAEAQNLIETGDVAEGIRLFRSLPVDPEDEISVVGLARVGDFTAAETDLHAMQAKYPQATLWNDYRAPEVEAAVAMAAHKPKDAITALERVRPLEGRDPVIPMLRADAYLAAGEPGLAEKSYRQVVEGPLQSPEIEEIPLSWLGLGRALAAQGKRAAAIDAYQRFLTRWAHADPDAKFMQQARQEFAALQRPAPAK
jgi:tetratricopeptide (TPR) repeat protein